MRPARALLPLLIACLLAGCGGDGPADTSTSATTGPASSPADADGKRFLVAALGDSITAGSPLWDPKPGVRAQVGPVLDEQSQYEYWAQQQSPAVDFRNCGVFGERTDQIALRLDECARGADALIIQGGINDVVQGRTVDATASDLRSMARRGVALGIPVALTEVLPWNNGHPAADSQIEAINQAMDRIGEQEDVAVLGFHQALDDPGEPGTMPANLTIDGDHPSVAGYRLLGEKVVAPFLRSIQPAG
jgi:lysophospholipase L1-like esterase